MAKSLNMKRIHISIVFAITTILILVFLPQNWADSSWQVILLNTFASVLVGCCAIGRVYCTAFLGGFKNQRVISDGPFSVVRNPLYVCSYIGILGIACGSNNIIILILMPIFFAVLFHRLVKREETFLLQRFGDEFKEYLKTVPRFIPKLSLYTAPETIEMCPKYLLNAIKDAVWWFTALPLLRLLQSL